MAALDLIGPSEKIPHSVVDEFDAKSGPLGAKGIGELGATGVAAAVGNAVFGAVGMRVRDLPITPSKLITFTKSIASS